MAKKRTKKQGYRAISLILTAFCLILIFLLGLMIVEQLRQPEESESEVAGESLTESETALAGETVLSGMPANTYDLEAFSTDGQFRRYSAAETFTGVDVSEHQGSIDWEAVADEGIDFAMIRVGYRGYSLGEINADANAAENLDGAADAGLHVGVYFFSQAITVDEAIEEARFVLDAIEGHTITYPVAFDWEPIEAAARTDGMDQETLTQCALAFCRTIENAGYTAAVYFNQSYGYQGFNLPQLLDYEFWLAQYDETPTFVFHFDMWQYSCTGRLNGIEGDVDLNMSFVDYADGNTQTADTETETVETAESQQDDTQEEDNTDEADQADADLSSQLQEPQ